VVRTLATRYRREIVASVAPSSSADPRRGD